MIKKNKILCPPLFQLFSREGPVEYLDPI